MLLMGAPCYLLGWASHAFTSCSREPCNPGVEGVAGGPLCESVHQMFREHLVCGGLPWGLRRERIRLQRGTPGFDPRVGKIPWRRKWQPTPVLLPGESRQRSLAGHSHGVAKGRT